jgi:peptidyl-tRNA hydrolase
MAGAVPAVAGGDHHRGESTVQNVVQYLIINREIVTLGAGVLAAQAAHASMAGYLIAAESEPARAWAAGTFTKIVLVVETEAALRELDAAPRRLPR